ncbi:MAG: transcription elongation factor GreA [Planctomycetia bacterium]|nr:transcription elongation factor GreA [Planctomycetia bacterium]
MAVDRVPMTREGYERLREEIDRLEKEEKPKILAGLAAAREEGDLSENAEYHGARENLAMLEARIAAMRGKLSRATIVDPARVPRDAIAFGATIRLLDLDTDEESRYTLVGAGDEDFSEGKILVTCPFAAGLVGKKVGEEVRITVPAGELHLKVLDISYEMLDET